MVLVTTVLLYHQSNVEGRGGKEKGCEEVRSGPSKRVRTGKQSWAVVQWHMPLVPECGRWRQRQSNLLSSRPTCSTKDSQGYTE